MIVKITCCQCVKLQEKQLSSLFRKPPRSFGDIRDINFNLKLGLERESIFRPLFLKLWVKQFEKKKRF